MAVTLVLWRANNGDFLIIAFVRRVSKIVICPRFLFYLFAVTNYITLGGVYIYATERVSRHSNDKHLECKSKRVCYKFRAFMPKSMSWIFRLTVEHHKNNIQSKNKNKSTHGPDINGSLEYREMYPLVQNAHIRNLYLCMTATFRNHGDINFNFFSYLFVASFALATVSFSQRIHRIIQTISCWNFHQSH